MSYTTVLKKQRWGGKKAVKNKQTNKQQQQQQQQTHTHTHTQHTPQKSLFPCMQLLKNHHKKYGAQYFQCNKC